MYITCDIVQYPLTFDLLLSKYQNLTWRFPTVTNMEPSLEKAMEFTYNTQDSIMLNRTKVIIIEIVLFSG